MERAGSDDIEDLAGRLVVIGLAARDGAGCGSVIDLAVTARWLSFLHGLTQPMTDAASRHCTAIK
jgi:hypothetical protein